MPSESSESEEEPTKEDPFLYSSSPASRVFSDDDSTVSKIVWISLKFDLRKNFKVRSIAKEKDPIAH